MTGHACCHQPSASHYPTHAHPCACHARHATHAVGSLIIGGGAPPGKRAWLERARPGARHLRIYCSASSPQGQALLGCLRGGVRFCYKLDMGGRPAGTACPCDVGVCACAPGQGGSSYLQLAPQDTVVAEVGRVPRCLPDPTVLPNLRRQAGGVGRLWSRFTPDHGLQACMGSPCLDSSLCALSAHVGRLLLDGSAVPQCVPPPSTCSLTINCLDADASWLSRLAELPHLTSFEVAVAARTPVEGASGGSSQPLELPALPALRSLKAYLEPGAPLLRVCLDRLPTLEASWACAVQVSMWGAPCVWHGKRCCSMDPTPNALPWLPTPPPCTVQEVEVWGSQRLEGEEEDDRGSAEMACYDHSASAGSGGAAGTACPSRVRRLSLDVGRARVDWAALPALEAAEVWASELQGGGSLAASTSGSTPWTSPGCWRPWAPCRPPCGCSASRAAACPGRQQRRWPP